MTLVNNSHIFALATRIADAHDRREGARELEVIPVLMTLSAAESAVLKALCAVVGGIYLDSAAQSLSPIKAGMRVAEVDAAIIDAFTVRSGPRTRDVLVTEDASGDRDVVFDGSVTAESASGGERAALQLARALLEPEIQRHDFVVLVYREDEMDLVLRDGAWGLVVGQLRGMTLGRLRTLVIVVSPKEGWIDPGVHCRAEIGFRYALLGNELLIRNTNQAVKSRIRQIARSDRPPVFFLGAGFSATSGIPLGDVLRNRAIENLLGTTDSKKNSLELAREFRAMMEERLEGDERTASDEEFASHLTFERVIREEKNRFGNTMPTLQLLAQLNADAVRSPGVAVTSLRQLIRDGMRMVVTTVNLDTLVEAGMEEHVEVFATDSEFDSATSYVDAYLRGDANKVPVLKLHGTIQNFDSCIVSDETTRLGIMGGKLDVLRRISDGDVVRDWAYVGASMRDFDLREFFRDHQFADHVNETWVAPYLVSTVREYEELRLAHWRVQDSQASMQDHLVTETADAFFSAMVAARNV